MERITLQVISRFNGYRLKAVVALHVAHTTLECHKSQGFESAAAVSAAIRPIAHALSKLVDSCSSLYS